MGISVALASSAGVGEIQEPGTVVPGQRKNEGGLWDWSAKFQLFFPALPLEAAMNSLPLLKVAADGCAHLDGER